MNSIWETLGLNGPETNLKTIEKAYAAKLRVTQRENDPMHLMVLKDAFEKAKEYARDNPDFEIANHSPAREEENEDSLSLDQILEDATSDQDEAAYTAPVKHQREVKRSEPVDKLVRKISSLIRKRDGRKDYRNWHKVLSKRNELSADDQMLFEHKLRETLLDLYDYDDRYRRRARKAKKRKTRYYKLPRKTLLAIFKEMNWNVSQAATPAIAEQLQWLCEEGGIVKEENESPREKSGDDDDGKKSLGWRSDLRRLFLLVLTIPLLIYTVSWLDPNFLDNSPNAKEAIQSPLLKFLYLVFGLLWIYFMFFLISRIIKSILFIITSIFRALVSALKQLFD